jgi:predicted acylesterase/phospholipase RssA
LVLGGGGARGFAHIGAIRALEEAGITIEIIGGTSQGALIGAQYAMGLSPDEMIATNRALFRDFRPFKGDITFPIFSFLTGVTSNKGLQGLFGKTYISDLKIPFFCISTNLSLAKLIVDRDHPVWKAVRCSMALPGLMPPVIEGGHLISDGGVLNNLPVDVMRENCNGGIIAVDVSPPVDLLVGCEDRETLSFLDFVRRKLFRRNQQGSIPHLVEILMRTAFLSSIHHRETMAKHADLLIHPPMSEYGLLAWDNLEKLVEIGYQTTREKLKHWTDSTTLRIVEAEAERTDVVSASS